MCIKIKFLTVVAATILFASLLRFQAEAASVSCTDQIEDSSNSSSYSGLKHDMSFDFATLSCVTGNGGCDASAFASTDKREHIYAREIVVFASQLTQNGFFRPKQDDDPESSCSRVSIEDLSGWLSPPVWLGKTSEILFVDPTTKNFVALGLDGSLRRPVPTLQAKKGTFFPARAGRYGDRLFVTTTTRGGQGAIVFDSALKVVSESSSLSGTGHSKGLIVKELVDWIVGDNHIVGYGAVTRAGDKAHNSATSEAKQPEERWLGILSSRVKNSAPSLDDTKQLLAVQDPRYQKYYQLGLGFFAMNEDHAFFVEFGPSTTLRKLSLSSGELTSLTSIPNKYLDVLPLPTELRGTNYADSFFPVIESSAMPIALAAEGKSLQVITREPIVGGTAWKIQFLDYANDILKATLKLPTNAGNLIVVPAGRSWLLVEREYNQGKDGQKPISLLRIPSAWILDPASSPLNIENGGDVVCKESQSSKQSSLSDLTIALNRAAN